MKCTLLMASPSLVLPPLAFPMVCCSCRLTHYSFLFVSAAIPVVHLLLPELYQLPPKLPHSPAPPEQPTSCCQTTYVGCQPMWSSLPYLKTTEVNGASAHPWAWTGKAVWELSQLPVFALPHSPAHPHTTPHTSHLRETSYSSSKSSHLPISYGSLILPIYWLIFISEIEMLLQDSDQVTSSMKSSLLFPQQLCSLTCFSHAVVSPLGHIKSTLHSSHE